MASTKYALFWTGALLLTIAAAGTTMVLAQPTTPEAPSADPPGEASAADSDQPQQPQQQAQPATSPPPPPPMDGYGGGGYRRWRGGGRWGMEIPSQEWELAAQFMEQHSPRRWRAYQSLPDERRQGVRRMIYVRYRNLQQLRGDDPELYDVRMRQLVMEDDIWRLVDELRASTSEEQREPIIQQIRQRVQETTALWLKEREHRLARQEAVLQTMREDLATDRQNLEEIINERVSREVERARLPENAHPEPPYDARPEEGGPGGDRPPRGDRPPPPGPRGREGPPR